MGGGHSLGLLGYVPPPEQSTSLLKRFNCEWLAEITLPSFFLLPSFSQDFLRNRADLRSNCS